MPTVPEKGSTNSYITLWGMKREKATFSWMMIYSMVKWDLGILLKYTRKIMVYTCRRFERLSLYERGMTFIDRSLSQKLRHFFCRLKNYECTSLDSPGKSWWESSQLFNRYFGVSVDSMMVTGGSERTSFPPHTKASPWGRAVWIPYVLVVPGHQSTSQSWTSKVENTKNQWLLHDIHCDQEKIWPNIDLNKSCPYVNYCIKDNIHFLPPKWVETHSFQNDCFLYKLRDDVPMNRLILAEVYIWTYPIWYVCIFYICKYT